MSLFGPNVEKMKKQGDITGLVHLLSHSDYRVSGAGAEALKHMGWETARIMDVAFSSPDERVHRACREVLAGLDWKFVRDLADILVGGDERLGREAAHALGRINWRYRSILPLEGAFQVPEASVRARAVVAYALGGCEGAREGHMAHVVDPLIGAVKDPDRRVRWTAAAALLAEYRDDVRQGSKRALQEMGVPYVELSVPALNDPDSYVRSWAIHAIGRNEERDAVQALLAAYQFEKEGELRREALFYLGRTFRYVSVELLMSALNDSDHGVRYEAIYVLEQYGDNRAIPALERVIEDRYVACTMHDYARQAIEAIRARETRSTASK